MRYRDLTAVFVNPTTGSPALPDTDTAIAKVFLVDQDQQAQLSEVASVILDPRNNLSYPGLMTNSLDTELLTRGLYRVYYTARFSGTLVAAPMETFELTVEDNNTKVIQ